MFEIGVLPQLLPFVLTKSTARFDFEAFHQAKEITGFIEALEQEMAMVRHDAISGDGEVFCCGFGLDGSPEANDIARGARMFCDVESNRA